MPRGAASPASLWPVLCTPSLSKVLLIFILSGHLPNSFPPSTELDSPPGVSSSVWQLVRAASIRSGMMRLRPQVSPCQPDPHRGLQHPEGIRRFIASCHLLPCLSPVVSCRPSSICAPISHCPTGGPLLGPRRASARGGLAGGRQTSGPPPLRRSRPTRGPAAACLLRLSQEGGCGLSLSRRVSSIRRFVP